MIRFFALALAIVWDLIRVVFRSRAAVVAEESVSPTTTGSVLGISEVTLKVHRSHAMRKMKAQSVADLVRMTAKLGILSEGEEPGAFRSYRNT